MDIISYLQKENIKKGDFAKSVPMSRNHFYRLINLRKNPSLEMAVAISKATNGEVTVEEILEPFIHKSLVEKSPR